MIFFDLSCKIELLEIGGIVLKKNKVVFNVFFILTLLFVTLSSLSTLYAQGIEENNEGIMPIQEDTKGIQQGEEIREVKGIFDTELSSTTYRMSDKKGIYLPFFRFSSDRILIDEKVSGFGSCFAGQSIEVNENIEGVQFLFATDSIRVNQAMEYGILFGGSNVTISAPIKKSLVIFAGQKITITEDAMIEGDVICYAPEIEVIGGIEGSLIGAVPNAKITGTIQKDLRIEVSNLDLAKEAIKGNVYLETYNTGMTLPEGYEGATIKIKEKVQRETFDLAILYTAVLTAAVFTLVYYMINKATKEKFICNGVKKIEEHPITVILSGSIIMLSIPVCVILLLFLSGLGLYMIGIPCFIFYTSYLLLAGLLSTFVVGAIITEYMAKSKYLKEKSGDGKVKYLFAFVMYLILYVLARMPYIGSYVTLALVMLSIGCITCILFSKQSDSKKKNISEKIVQDHGNDKE